MYYKYCRQLNISPLHLLVAIFLSINAVISDLVLAGNISGLFVVADRETLPLMIAQLVLSLLYSISSNLLNNYFIAFVTFRSGNKLFKRLVSLYIASGRLVRSQVSQESVSNLAIVQITNICGGIILPILTAASSVVLICVLTIYAFTNYTNMATIAFLIIFPIVVTALYLSTRSIKVAGTQRLNSSLSLSNEIYNLNPKSMLFQSIKSPSSLAHKLTSLDLAFRNSERKFFVLNAIPSNAIDSALVLAIVCLSLAAAYQPSILSAGSISSFGFIALRLVSRSKSLVSSINKYKSYKSSLKKYQDVLGILKSNDNADDSFILKSGISSTTSVAKSYVDLESPIKSELEDLYQSVISKIEPGVKIIIQGRSGSGKSTFLQLLAEYFVNSQNPSLLNIQAGDCILIDQYPIIFPWSILDNISLCRTIQDSDKTVINDFIQLYNLPFYPQSNQKLVNYDYLQEQIPVLSGGEAQRFSLIRALYKYHDLILLDEPLSSQDPQMASIITQSINIYHRKHPTSIIVMISHSKNDHISADWIPVTI